MAGRYSPPAQVPTPREMPVCGGGCGRSGVVLYQGYCNSCTAAEERAKENNRG